MSSLFLVAPSILHAKLSVKPYILFTVDRAGKVSSSFFATINNDQVSVSGPLSVYQSSNYAVGLTAANLQPEMNWRANQNKNFRFRNINTNNTVMTLTQNGRVGINTENFFGNHRLYVEGSIYISENTDEVHSLYIEGSSIAEEMFVKIKEEWGDYVFKKDYMLLPLNDLEKFINENGHLPDMPTAEEVKAEGVKTGETIRLLTIKVEELTLYLLQQQKEIEVLKAEIKQ